MELSLDKCLVKCYNKIVVKEEFKLIKVKASLLGKLPTDVVIDIPKNYCNRDEWNGYIKEYLSYLFDCDSKIDYEVLEDGNNRKHSCDDEYLSDSFCSTERTAVG